MKGAQLFIPVNQLSQQYKIELTFFDELEQIGLIEITTYEEQLCISLDKLGDLEKMIRIHQELNINLEGVDVVFNLLQKVDELKSELIAAKNKLRLYER